jgi:hypothetical protein
LEWFRIQEDIMKLTENDTDIVIFLDCCYAAQAGRQRLESVPRIELLAAAAMGMQTPMPGDRSFTTALIRELELLKGLKQPITLPKLQSALVNRKAQLWATPIYIPLRPGRREIRFQPVPSQHQVAAKSETEDAFFKLIVNVKRELSLANLDEMVQWLGTDMPKIVTRVRVDTMLDMTATIHDFVTSSTRENDALRNSLEGPAFEEVLRAWDHVTSLLKQYNIRTEDGVVDAGKTEKIQQRAHEFLTQLQEVNANCLDTIEWNVLNSSLTSNNEVLQKIADDPTTIKFGIADHLRLRQIAQDVSPESFEQYPSSTCGSVSMESKNEWQEVKSYGRYLDPGDLPSLTERVRKLAKLLSMPKSEQFLSLRCLGWQHEPLDDQFVLRFQIPQELQVAQGMPANLNFIIREAKGASRPTLNERLIIASLIANAVHKWHSVAWLHQCINSGNVLFFSKIENRVEFTKPFLQGFEFARPDSDPSIVRSPDEIAFNVYRHPDRQGSSRKSHLKIHDLYSLGVVLLEIGLWEPAIDIVKRKQRNTTLSGELIRKELMRSCSERLGHYMGHAYREAVRTCLAGDLIPDVDDRNQSHLSRRFQKRVIDELKKGIHLS